MAERPVLVASNRGGIAFARDSSGELAMSRGGGGLAAGLAGVMDLGDTIWMSAAMSETDREAMAEGFDRRSGAWLLDIEPRRYGNYYDRISNETLWFLHHGLFDLAREPAFDHEWDRAWEDFKQVNAHFATALAEAAPPNAIVLVQDYHLSLVGADLKAQRPDISAVHFHHTPFAEASLMDVLPARVARELMEGLAGFDACGFHSPRWSDCFAASCERVGVAAPATFVSPLPISPDALTTSAQSDAVASSIERFDGIVGDLQFLVRVDRIELSKNLIRGFQAFDELLETYPDHVGRLVFGAFCYPSRPNVEAYATYRADAQREVDRINAKWGTPEWQPILFETDDDYPRSVAALVRADAVLVNPIRDGLNLVAKEAALVNARSCRVVLSEYAGVHDELADYVRSVNPYDISDTAEAIHEALTLGDEQRRQTAEKLRAAATKRAPADWLADQLAAISGDVSGD